MVNKVARWAFFLLAIATEASAQVSVDVNPKTFSLDSGTLFSIKVENGQLDQVPVPKTPDGISIRPSGTSTNMQFSNGRMSRSVTQNYIITASEVGEYQIKSFEIKVDGTPYETGAVNFTVTAGAPPAVGGSGQSNSASSQAGQDSFIKVEFPTLERNHLYVGEVAPIRIKAYLPASGRASLRSKPRPLGSGFTLKNVSDSPDQTTEDLDGKRYRVLTWYAGISVAKAGSYPIEIGLDATVMVPTGQQRPRRRHSSPFGNSLFDDPIFDSFFNGGGFQTVPKEVSLRSEGDAMEIRSLPIEGRPDNFTGAVGQFEMKGYSLPADAVTGEPQKIRVAVGGRGNFDRLQVPTLNPSDEWNTYQPKTEFNAADIASFSGQKLFQFSAVPKKSGNTNLSLSFSYFDPATESYEVVSSREIPVTITAGDPESESGFSVTATPPATSPSESEADTATTTNPLASFRPIDIRASSALSPLIQRPLFWIIFSLSVLAAIGGLTFGRIRQYREEPSRVAAKRSLEKQDEAMREVESALAANRSDQFFDAARAVLQTQLSRLWNLPADSITLSEVKQRIPEHKGLQDIFMQADAIDYSGGDSMSDKDELSEWNERLNEALDAIASEEGRV